MFRKAFLFSLLILTVILQNSRARTPKELPSYFPKCYKDDPKFNECMLKATDDVRPYLIKGVPELDFLPISPLTIPKISLEQGTGRLNYKAHFQNVVVKGLEHYHFSKLEFDPKNITFAGAVDCNYLNLAADYFVEGRILTVPLIGKGEVKANFTDLNSTLEMHGRLVRKKHFTYIQPDRKSIMVNVSFGNVTYQLNGLFGDNEVLAKAARELLNNNLREILEEIKPAIQEALATLVQDFVLKSVCRVPFEKLFPLRNKPN